MSDDVGTTANMQEDILQLEDLDDDEDFWAEAAESHRRIVARASAARKSATDGAGCASDGDVNEATARRARACRHGTRSDTTSAGPEAPDEDDAVAPLVHHYDPERKGVKLHWCLKRGSIVRVWWKGCPPHDCRLILSGDGRTFVRANRGEFQGDIPIDLRRDEWKFVRRTCKKDNIEDKCLNCILPWRKLKCQYKSHLHHPDDFADKYEGANASHRPNQSLEDAMHVRQAAPRTRTNQELIVLLDQLKMRANSCQREKQSASKGASGTQST